MAWKAKEDYYGNDEGDKTTGKNRYYPELELRHTSKEDNKKNLGS